MRVRGPIITLFTLLVSIFSPFPAEMGVLFRVYIFFAVTAIIIIITFADALASALNTYSLPVVKHSGKQQEGDRSYPLIILEASPIYSYGTIVSIYHLNDDYEEWIGNGRVYNIQENKLFQVIVLEEKQECKEIWEKIMGNKDGIFKSLIVKPGMLYSNPD